MFSNNLIRIFACWLLLCLPVWAQVPMTGAGLAKPTASGGGYVGPGDIVSGAFEWWGMRCYSNAYAGNVADITDTATGTTLGTRLQCSSGTVSALVSGSACTFVTGNACSTLATTCTISCSITLLYDQSGNTNCTAAACDMQPVSGTKPTVTVSCQNSHPCMVFNGAQAISPAASLTSTQAQPFTMSYVAERTGNTTSFSTVLGASGASLQFGFGNAINTAAIYAGATISTAAAADNAYHAVQGVFNSAVISTNSSLAVDGTTTPSLSPGTSGLSGFMIIGSGNNFLTGQVTEVGIWASTLTGTQQTNLNANQHTYWGF